MAEAAEGPHVMMPRSAMVMAAGFGTRMQPLTLTTPKPMLELGGKPLIDYALDHMAAAGIETVVVNLHYLGDQIERHVAARAAPKIHFQHEAEVLETGGGALMALPVLGRAAPFFAFNADTVYQDGPRPVLQRLAEHWNDGTMDGLLLLQPTPAGQPGDYVLGANGRLTYRPNGETAPYGFTAVSLNHPRLLDDPPDGAFSLKKVWDRAEARGRLFGLLHDGKCYHLSTPADLEAANRDFA